MLRTLLLALLLLVPAQAMCKLDLGELSVEPIWDLQRYQTAVRLWDEADEFWHQGDFDNTIRVLQQIISVDSTDTEAYESAGWLMESTDRTFEGFDMLVQSVLANPRSGDAHFELGMKFYFLGGYDIAVQKMEKALYYPCPPIAERMLAHAYERAGERDKAIGQFAVLVGRDPNDGAALMNLLRVLGRIEPVGDPTDLWHRPEVREQD